jgi:ribonuclease Z
MQCCSNADAHPDAIGVKPVLVLRLLALLNGDAPPAVASGAAPAPPLPADEAKSLEALAPPPGWRDAAQAAVEAQAEREAAWAAAKKRKAEAAAAPLPPLPLLPPLPPLPPMPRLRPDTKAAPAQRAPPAAEPPTKPVVSFDDDDQPESDSDSASPRPPRELLSASERVRVGLDAPPEREAMRTAATRPLTGSVVGMDPAERTNLRHLPLPAEGYNPDDVAPAGLSHHTHGLDLEFLGTSSGVPTPWRNVSGLGLRVGGDMWLFDAGEATQHRLMASASLPLCRLRRIFVTHCHGDHVFGLPGVIAAVSAARASSIASGTAAHDVDAPVHVYGPPGVGAFLEGALRFSATALRMHVIVHELYEDASPDDAADVAAAEEAERGADGGRRRRGRPTVRIVHEAPARPGRVPSWGAGPEAWAAAQLPAWRLVSESHEADSTAALPLTVWAAPLRHRVPCVGYVVAEADAPGRLQPEAAAALGLHPGSLFRDLKRGLSVEAPGGNTVRPDDVMLPPRPGRKICVLGDTCDSSGIEEYARHADVLIHEATFQNDLASLAARAGHSTAAQAGAFAARVKARTLVLTHFSARYPSVWTDRPGSDGEEAALEAAEGYAVGLAEETTEALEETATNSSRAITRLVHEAMVSAKARLAPGAAPPRVLAAQDFMRIPVARKEAESWPEDAPRPSNMDLIRAEADAREAAGLPRFPQDDRDRPGGLRGKGGGRFGGGGERRGGADREFRFPRRPDRGGGGPRFGGGRGR